MKVLVTGAKGFVGRNLIAELFNQGYQDIFQYDIDTDTTLLDEYCREADFVFHLAGVNRPEKDAEFMEGNFGFAEKVLNALENHGNHCPVMLSSSIQASVDNPYGRSKRAVEDLMRSFGQRTGSRIFIYRFQNVFGKWCRPNYNSVIATFCHNAANDLPITVNDPSVILNLVYIDDVIAELINLLKGNPSVSGDFCEVLPTHQIPLGTVFNMIQSFKESRENRYIPDMSDPLIKKLYSTYLSYLPQDRLRYPLLMNCDDRGSFTEFIKTLDRGQVSINVSKPNIVKGNHWHHSKNEKFLVVSGSGIIRLRKLGTSDILEYVVSGSKLEVVDIPAGYTHNIENIGQSDLVTVIWVNEIFDSEKPDTYALEV